MDEQFKRKLRKRREALYLAVKNQRPDLYEAAVHLGHLAMEAFVPGDEVHRAAEVEAAAMSLAAKAAEIDVPLEPLV